MSFPYAPFRRHASPMGVALLLLGACTPPAPPALSLPTGVVTVAHAESVSIDRFLAPTALGAKDDLLCPWARGEPVPDASLARWTAEKRLSWRVVEVGPGGATFDGATDLVAAATASVANAAALATRCGTPARVEALVAIAPETPAATVDLAITGLGRNGLGPLWMLVEDPTPGAATGASAGEGKATPKGGTYTVLVGRGSGTTVIGAGGAFPVGGVAPPPPGFVEAAGCGSLATDGPTTWRDMAGAADVLRGVGLTELAVGLLSKETAAHPGEGAAGATATVAAKATRAEPAVDVPLHGTVAAFPLGPCDYERCACSAIVSDAPAATTEPAPPAAYDPANDPMNGR